MNSIALGVISEEQEKISLRKHREKLRAKFGPDISKSFRLKKEAFECVLNEVKGEMCLTLKSRLSPKDKLAACLRFFAKGNYQNGTGQNFEVAIAQSTFSKLFTEM